MKHDFEQRKENRIANAENQALKDEAKSEQLYLRSKEMASVIPMEQPILLATIPKGVTGITGIKSIIRWVNP